MKSYKVKLKLNNKQKSKCYEISRACHYLYNWCLELQETSYIQGKGFINFFSIGKELTKLKKEKEWLNKIPRHALNDTLKKCCTAYKRFFEKRARHPKFKSKKKSKLSFSQHNIYGFHIYENGRARITNVGIIKFFNKNYIPINKKYCNIHITSEDNGNSWYLSLSIDEPQEIKEFKQEGIGIDLGLKDLAILDDGTKFENINKTERVKKLEKRLKRTQRAVNRKYEKNKDGKKYIKTQNLFKQETKLKRQYQRLTNIRNDYINKMISNIIKREPSFVVMENLNVSGMMKNRHLSKAVAQCKFYTIRDKLQKKLANTTSQFILADRFYPSSKICNHCGNIKKDLKLKDRVYHCECGYIEDRDINASKNLYQLGKEALKR